jgi:hypothetical protein
MDPFTFKALPAPLVNLGGTKKGEGRKISKESRRAIREIVCSYSANEFAQNCNLTNRKSMRFV